MASDRQQFKAAAEKRDLLYSNRSFSAPPKVGRIAIISSFFTDEELDTERGITELNSFRSEAYALADRVRGEGGVSELAIDASREDINTIIKDPSISSMYIIGNGSLSSLILAERDYYDWVNASDASDHLKLGKIIQRQCGGLPRALNVPLGLFVVSEPVNVRAALNEEFYPASLEDPVNDMILPVFSSWPVTYNEVKSIKIPGISK